MKLTDCHPVWWGAGPEPGRKGLGISFDCPICVREGRLSLHGPGPFPTGAERTDRTFAPFFPVAFANPLDGGPALPPDTDPITGQLVHKARWQRTGETFETLTLSPSIDASAQDHGTHKGWHGHCQNGVLTGDGV